MELGTFKDISWINVMAGVAIGMFLIDALGKLL